MSRFPFAFAFLTSLILAPPVGRAASPPAVVTPPSPIQMLVPGFAVRELPLDLNNINNLVYAPDGRLFALAYDGNVFQLSDTNHDGIEETASKFFDNERGEIPASIGMCWGPGGLYIASRGRVFHLHDQGNGTAKLEVVTSGWVQETKAAGSNLDAVGIATDAKGQIYFGLGCDAWSEAYRIDQQTGLSAYNLYSERGTILKLSSDWKRRDILCTGLRFPVALAFNAAGDLFCTDQEGATWLPNGNPFDELLHIQPGRHYGFPPRHPQHLPGVIDEPSVFNYRPQHQSTCGLHFNEGAGGSSNIFGPTWWRGDAFVAGESRGKIWRTKLVKTPAGYVAQNNLIACLSMLTIDAVPTPDGAMLVACHSGAPDWGTGPKGKGKLFKIAYADASWPQPLFAYAANLTETTVVFDRPLDPARLKTLTRQSSITMGDHAGAGDRYESFVPGYQAVKDQKATPLQALDVLSASVSPDYRSIVLHSPPRTSATHYGIAIPEDVNSGRSFSSPTQALAFAISFATPPQQAMTDLLLELTGAEVSWRSPRGELQWSGWLPHVDLKVARAFTAVSETHQRLFALCKSPGVLSFLTQLDLNAMLRPAIQPGAKLDYTYAPESVTVTFTADSRMDVAVSDRTAAKVLRVNDRQVRITVPSPAAWLPIRVNLVTAETEPTLEVSWQTAEDARPRALPLRRVLLPWATPPNTPTPPARKESHPGLAGGNWERGLTVFFGEQAACSKCHQVGGVGGKVGPDLSNLVHRDYESVLKDIEQPSAALNPERLAYNITLRDGETISGVILEDDATQLIIGQVTGSNLVLAKDKIAGMKASAISLMPEGIFQGLTTEQRRDLMTFLLIPPAPRPHP